MEIENKILVLIEEKGYGKVDKNAIFANIGFDSLDMVELIMEIEKEFKITIADEETFKLVTVEDAVKLVQNKIQ